MVRRVAQGVGVFALVLAIVGCGDDLPSMPLDTTGQPPGSTGTVLTDGPDSSDDGDGSSSSGEIDEDVDASCSVHYRWEPGVGDISSFPTMEMTTADDSTPTGVRVSLPLDAFPDLSVYGRYSEEVASALSRLDGFGIQGEAFARFDGALDPDVLPPADANAGPDDRIGLVVMPAGGEPYLAPVGVELTDEGETVMVHPMFGLPPSTDVALWVRRSFGVADGDCVGASAGMRAMLDEGEGTIGSALDALASLGVVDSGDDLALLQPYPTQSATAESIAIAEHIAAQPGDAFSLTDYSCETTEAYEYCTSQFSTPEYRDEDGLVAVDVDAVEPRSSWDITVHAWLPLAGEGPHPTILYGHGLTGSGTQGAALATGAASRGIATVAISAVMHGDHPSLGGESVAGLEAILRFFAADLAEGTIDSLRLRDHFRQSTYDKLNLTRLLQSGADLDGDLSPDVDPARLAYLGISLGGLMGNELLALSESFTGGVLVMPGGRVTTVMTDPAGSFSDVLSLLIPPEFTEGDERRLFALLQTTLDAGDPASYGPHLLHDRLIFAAEGPDLLVGVALDDDIVVNQASWALTRAMGLDVVPPTLREVPGLGQTDAAPLSGNLPRGVTAGMLQFDVIEDETGATVPATHINLSFSEVAQVAWWGFLDSLFADGTATIIDPYQEVGLEHR